MNPLVTISVPLFKCENFLVACLESVRLQTYQNVEVTLINDQTPDNSVEIAEHFISKNRLGNWKIHHLGRNSGLSVVRNKGIETARGKYIFFLDSDDQILPDAITDLVKMCEDHGLQMAIGDTETVNLETGAITDAFSVNTSEKMIRGNRNIFRGYVNADFPTTSWNKLVETEFLRKNKLYFTKDLYAQDELHSFQLFLKLESVGCLHKQTYRYFLHKNSVIHNRDKKHFDSWATIARYFDAALKPENPEEVNILIKTYLINYKTMTLIMNWKAKKDEKLWIYSYNLYRKVPNLKLSDYFGTKYSIKTRKKALKLELPAWLAMKLFKYQYYS